MNPFLLGVMVDFVASWFLVVNHFGAHLSCVELASLTSERQEAENINERNFVKENNPCTLKDGRNVGY